MDVRERSTYAPGPDARLDISNVEASAGTRSQSQPAANGNLDPRQDSSSVSAAGQAVTAALQLPEVRQDRVAALQQQIAAGSYQVDPQAVADAILRQV